MHVQDISACKFSGNHQWYTGNSQNTTYRCSPDEIWTPNLPITNRKFSPLEHHWALQISSTINKHQAQYSLQITHSLWNQSITHFKANMPYQGNCKPNYNHYVSKPRRWRLIRKWVVVTGRLDIIGSSSGLTVYYIKLFKFGYRRHQRFSILVSIMN